MSDPFDSPQSADLAEFVEELLERRDEHEDDEWLRNQLAQLDASRREQLEPFLSDPEEFIDVPEGYNVTVRTTGTTPDRNYDADWPPEFDGWEGQSKPDRSNTEDGFLRRFTWRYRGRRNTWEMTVPGSLFRYYTERERTRSFGAYISDPFDEQIISSLANRVRSFGNETGLDQREQINAAVRFVQSLEYTPDDVTTGQVEYPKYPVETLVHEGGDCEDTSILLGAILRELGCEVALLVLSGHHHMILGVSPNVDVDGTYYDHDGTRYYTLEATGHGWDIGDMPRQYRNASAEIHPVGNDPILVHEWQATPQDDGSIEVTANVANFGDASAENLEVYIEFEDDEESTLARDRLEGDSYIPPSVTKQYVSTTQLPDDRRIRGRCAIVCGYNFYDASTSDWQ